MTASDTQPQYEVELTDSCLLRFFEYNGSPLLETTAGETARAVGVPVFELHHKLDALVESGRLWRHDLATYTFVKTKNAADTHRYLAAKIGLMRTRRGNALRSEPDTRPEPEEIDLDVDVDLTADIDFME